MRVHPKLQARLRHHRSSQSKHLLLTPAKGMAKLIVSLFQQRKELMHLAHNQSNFSEIGNEMGADPVGFLQP